MHRAWSVWPTRIAAPRIAQQVATVLAAHGTPNTIVDEERRHMLDCRLARTANRSVVGIMNEFAYLAEVYRTDDAGQDLVDLAVRLARTPCGPRRARPTSTARRLHRPLKVRGATCPVQTQIKAWHYHQWGVCGH
jgi:hypothetical protein